MIFGLSGEFGRGVFRVQSMYNPYINYTWSMLPNGQVQNTGTSGTNLQLYSGNPLDFQGSQNINIDNPYVITNAHSCNIVASSSNTNNSGYMISDGSFIIRFYQNNLDIFTTGGTIADVGNIVFQNNRLYNILYQYDGETSQVYLDGVLIYNELSTGGMRTAPARLSIGSRNNDSTYFDGQLDYLTISDRVLTPEEIALSNSNPNAFYEAMKNDANTLFCTDFRGNGAYIADDKNVSVGSERIVNGGFNTQTDWSFTDWTVLDGVCSVSSTTNTYLAKTDGLSFEPDRKYVVSIDVLSISGSIRLRGNNQEIAAISSAGSYSFIFNNTNNSVNLQIHTVATTNVTIDNISVKEVSAVYPITNYSETQRTNFQQEPTGLQELLIERDNLGFYVGSTDYLNCNGVGYGDTGWIPPFDVFTIEAIIETNGTVQKEGQYTNSSKQTSIETTSLDKIRVRIGSSTILSFSTHPNQKVYVSYGFDGTNLFASFNGNTILKTATTYDGANGTYVIARLREYSAVTNADTYTTIINLRKVHQKVLTQEEITNNYNDYVAQGLLS